jgi:CheY-like chemotaxis protein
MPGLKGTSILLVEDVLFIAFEVAEVLRDAGCKVVGPVGTLSEALAAVNRNSFDGAVIDVNLHGEKAFPIMEALERAALPFVIVTGYGRDQLPRRFRHHTLIAKPFSQDEFLEGLAAALQLPPAATAA